MWNRSQNPSAVLHTMSDLCGNGNLVRKDLRNISIWQHCELLDAVALSVLEMAGLFDGPELNTAGGPERNKLGRVKNYEKVKWRTQSFFRLI